MCVLQKLQKFDTIFIGLLDLLDIIIMRKKRKEKLTQKWSTHIL